LHRAITECCLPTYQRNHEITEGYPLVDAARKWKNYKQSQKEKNTKTIKTKINKGKKKELKKSHIQKLGSPGARG